MGHHRYLSAIGVVVGGVATIGTLGFAEAQKTPGSPDDLIVPGSGPAVSRSDEDRVVGRVVEIDHGQGEVKLATDHEGIVVMKAPRLTLRVMRVGDVVSVPRSTDESSSASPRE